MVNKWFVRFTFIGLFFVSLTTTIAQKACVDPYLPAKTIFKEDSVMILIDSTMKLTFEDILTSQYQDKFRKFDSISFLATNKDVAYWIKYKLNTSGYKGPVFIEMGRYIHSIDLYVNDTTDHYIWQRAGMGYHASDWTFKEASNYAFIIPEVKSSNLIYCRMVSDMKMGLGQLFYGYSHFLKAKEDSFLLTGILVGILFMMLSISLLLWIWLKDNVYIFYFMYILNFAIFTMVGQGNISLLLSGLVRFSYDFYTIPYALMTIYFMLYVHSFIKASDYPGYKLIVIIAIVIRLVMLAMPYTVMDFIEWRWQGWDMLFLIPSFYVAYLTYKGKNNLFLPLAGSIFVIFMAQLVHTFGIQLTQKYPSQNFTIIGIFQVFMFMIALAVRFLQLKREKENIVQEVSTLKGSMNRELVKKVKERTQFIKNIYDKLRKEKNEIEENYIEAAEARVTQKRLTYSEFKKIYPDGETCLRLIENLKWKDGYKCRKCGNEKFSRVAIHLSRKCSKCGAIESTQAHTIFSGVKFPIDKAMYMLIVLSSGKEVPATELSKELSLRLQTCWHFKLRLKERLDNFTGKFKGNDDWQKIILR